MSLIPVNNKPALIGYYLGFAALIPLCGCAFGVAAVILGVLGVIKSGHLNGEGRVHAIVAIVLGAGSILIYGLIDFILFVASISNSR